MTRPNKALSGFGLERCKSKARLSVVAEDEINLGIAEVTDAVVKDDRMALVHIASRSMGYLLELHKECGEIHDCDPDGETEKVNHVEERFIHGFARSSHKLAHLPYNLQDRPNPDPQEDGR